VEQQESPTPCGFVSAAGNIPGIMCHKIAPTLRIKLQIFSHLTLEETEDKYA
jgi:hypothetical protein